MKNYIKEQLKDSNTIHADIAMDESLHESLFRIAKACVESIRSGGKVLLAGNGGSAADCQHIAGELVSKFAFDRPGLPSVALTTDTSILTAIGNDYGFDQIFERQLQAIGRKGDVFIAYSTSGKSVNILKSLAFARDNQLLTVGFTEASKGSMANLCDFILSIPSTSTPRIQEGHLLLGHTLCGLIERIIFEDNHD